MFSKRGFILWDELLPWLVGGALLLLLLFLYIFIIYPKGSGGISFIEDFFRFGG